MAATVGGHDRILLAGVRLTAARHEGAVGAALLGGKPLQVLRSVDKDVALGKPGTRDGAAPEHEVQVVALARLQVPPAVLCLVCRVELVHRHVDGVVLEEARHGDAVPDLEVPAQQVDDLRDAPEAHGVCVLRVDARADPLDGFGVFCQPHLLALDVEAALLEAAKFTLEWWRRRPSGSDNDLIPCCHVRHEMGQLGIWLL
mmetsp:Transcript_23422/g.31612  ORF Transcript_23422/g.31612 Transcript_23422/m.31612 type:complete len:201 (+) Transcript_23422:253-855(+)